MSVSSCLFVCCFDEHWFICSLSLERKEKYIQPRYNDPCVSILQQKRANVMASRDLTAAFVERRSAANLRRRSAIDAHGGLKPFSDDHLLMEQGIPSASSMGGPSDRTPSASAPLPPQWIDDVDAVHAELSDISRLTSILQSLHASRVGAVFGRDLEDMEGKIERMTRDITDRFRVAERLLQRVGSATRRAGGEEAAVGANVQRSLAKKLQELSVEFRQKQRKYLADVQAQKLGGAAGERESRFGIDIDEGGGNASDGRFTMQQVAVVDDLQEAVQSRDKEIADIAKSIEELGAIFKELAVLVIDQGTILDRIDYNMEAVVEHTKEGIQQLERADTHQKSARPMKCIVCLMFTIALLLLILIIKHRRKRNL